MVKERKSKTLKAPERKVVKPEGGGGARPAVARAPRAPRMPGHPAGMGGLEGAHWTADIDAVNWAGGVRKSSRAVVQAGGQTACYWCTIPVHP